MSASVVFCADDFGMNTAVSKGIAELAQLHGLVVGTDLVVTPTSRTAGSVVQTITGDGTTISTVSRV